MYEGLVARLLSEGGWQHCLQSVDSLVTSSYLLLYAQVGAVPSDIDNLRERMKLEKLLLKQRGEVVAEVQEMHARVSFPTSY